MEISQPKSIEAWVQKQLRLIKLDYDEELGQNQELRSKNSLKQLEKNGHAVRKLIVTNQRSAFGRKVIQLSVRPEKRDLVNLINSGMTHGDIVGVTTQEQTTAICTGVVLQVKRLNLEIACDSETTVFDEHEKFNLIQLTNDVTYRRIKFALENLYSCSIKNYLIGLLFGQEPLLEPLSVLTPYTSDLPYPLGGKSDEIVWFNNNLNYSQKNAIEFALHQKHLAIIHGPPGTGKTTTLTELILQMITRGLKLLVCAPSNVAVDNIFKQLISSSQKHLCSKYRLKRNYNFVRIGHPARMDTDIQQYSLDSIVMNEGADLFNDLKSEINKMRSEKQNRSTRGQIRERQKEYDQHEEKVSKEKLREAHVIMSTCNGAVMNGQLRYLYDDLSTFTFDVVVIDECAQALEASTWIPLSYAKKCILGGDHKQLPATICSQEAADEGLGVSLIERVVDLFKECPDKVVRMLTVQYRMNKLIMNWPSSYFYQGRLEAAESVAERKISLANSNEPFSVIRLIDTVGCSMYELDPELHGLSKGNIHEVNIVCIVIKELIDGGLSPSDIGVISPYRLQTSLIEAGCRKLFPESITDHLEINSVDAFQGREKEVIILSLVRSNDQGSIGFLIEERRLNVAITRARSHLTVVCDSGTVTRDCDALKEFIDYCYEYGITESASDYQERMDEMEDILPTSTQTNQNKTVTSGKEPNKHKHQNKRETKNQKKRSNKITNEHNQTKTNHETDNQIMEQLNKFVKNIQLDEMKLSPTLNSFQRRTIYQRCEQLNLAHETLILDDKVVPAKKQIVVRKKT